jgi:PAS domain-containing protein
MLEKLRTFLAAASSAVTTVGSDLDSSGRLRLRAVLRDGYGTFLISVFLALLTAFLFRATVRTAACHYERVQHNIAETLEGRQIARRDDDYSGVTGALLRAYDSRSFRRFADDCGGDDCATIFDIWRVFAALHQAAISPSVDGARGWVDTAEAIVRGRAPTLDVPAWRAQVQSLIRGLQADTAGGPALTASEKAEAERLGGWVRAELVPGDPEVGRERPLPDFGNEPHQLDYGQKTRDANDDRYPRVTRLTIPSLVSMVPVPDRIDQAARQSLLLEFTIAPFLPIAKSKADEYSSQAVQAYVISLDDVLRIWSRPRSTLGTIARFPPLRRWASEEYVSVFTHLPKLDEYLSPPYIDFGGHGVVRTWCHPLETGAEKAARLTGVFCVDYTVPLATLRDYWRTSALLVDINYVRLAIAPDRIAPDAICVSPQWPPDCGLAPSSNLEAARSGIKELLARERSTYGDPGEAYDALARATSAVQLEGHDFAGSNVRTAFLVPLGRYDVADPRAPADAPRAKPVTEDSEYLYAVLVRPNPSLPPLVFPFAIAAVIAGLLFVLVVLVGGRQIRALEEIDEQVTLLRALQVGVIVVSENDFIAEANDRAEEVLGVPLPKIGAAAQEANLSTRFDQLIRRYIVEEEAGGELLPVKYSRVIPRRRRAGEASEYYAKLATGAREGHWINVAGSPMITQGSGTRDGTRTFGVVDAVVDPLLEARLDEVHALRAPTLDSFITDPSGVAVAFNGAAAKLVGWDPRTGSAKWRDFVDPVAIWIPTGAPPRAFAQRTTDVSTTKDTSFFVRTIAPKPRWVRVTRRPLAGERRGFAVNMVEPLVDDMVLVKELDRYHAIGSVVLKRHEDDSAVLVVDRAGDCAVTPGFQRIAGHADIPLFLAADRAPLPYAKLVDATVVGGELWVDVPDGLLAPPVPEVLVRTAHDRAWYRLKPDAEVAAVAPGLRMFVALAEPLDAPTTQLCSDLLFRKERGADGQQPVTSGGAS